MSNILHSLFLVKMSRSTRFSRVILKVFGILLCVKELINSKSYCYEDDGNWGGVKMIYRLLVNSKEDMLLSSFLPAETFGNWLSV